MSYTSRNSLDDVFDSRSLDSCAGTVASPPLSGVLRCWNSARNESMRLYAARFEMIFGGAVWMRNGGVTAASDMLRARQREWPLSFWPQDKE